MATDFTDLKDVLKQLGEAQEADQDIRDAVREAHHFIDKRDGQWEPEIIQKFKAKPRYTFDKCGPIVDQLAGEISNSDLTLRVRPSGGESTKDNAQVYDGLIRNIRNISNAENVFNNAARSMITGGMDGWEVVQDWVDADAFEQDLFIRKIHNWVDRVWFLGDVQEQDNSDASAVIVLSTISIEEYKDQFPDAKSSASIGDGRNVEVYTDKPSDTITIGRIQYKKEIKIEIVRMSNGKVYRVDDDFEKIADELADAGITEEARRTRKSWRVHSRVFNNNEWLTEEEKTVFDILPVCATYGNYKISENKRIVRGVVEKLIDPQRVLNYALSRDIEEGALKPRDKIMMTLEQMEGHQDTLQTLNINTDPVQPYNHVDGQPAPFFTQTSQVNQGLQATAANMSESINASAGLFSANMGDNPGLQSGVAIDRQISKGDNGSVKWLESLEIAVCYTGKVLLGSIPRVYDSTRQVRILAEDGEADMVTLNQRVFDEETQSIVELNNLAAGQYDVVCEVGPAFKSQQREAVAAFAEMAAIDPTIIELARDKWLSQTGLPSMDIIAKRSRALQMQQGVVLREEFTEEEEAMAQQAEQQAAQQQPQEDPNALLAQAEILKGQAEQQQAANKQAEIQGAQQLKAQELQLKQQEIQLEMLKFERANDDKFNVDAAKINQGQQKLDQEQQKIALSQQKTSIDAQQNQEKIDLQSNDQRFNQVMQTQAAIVETLGRQAETLETLRNAMGVDAIVGPGNTKAYIQQARLVTGAQEGQPQTQPEDVDIPGLDVDRGDEEL